MSEFLHFLDEIDVGGGFPFWLPILYNLDIVSSNYVF